MNSARISSVNSDEVIDKMTELFFLKDDVSKDFHNGILNNILDEIKGETPDSDNVQFLRQVLARILSIASNELDDFYSHIHNSERLFIKHKCLEFENRIKYHKHAFYSLSSKQKTYLSSMHPREFWYDAVSAYVFGNDIHPLQLHLGTKTKWFLDSNEFTDAVLGDLISEIEKYIDAASYHKIANSIYEMYQSGEKSWEHAKDDLEYILNEYHN